MKKYIIDIVLALGILLAVFTASFTDFSVRAEEVQSEVLRLHIPANSDSDEDQQTKLALRDYILEQYGAQLSDSSSLDEAENRVRELLPEIEAACNDFLAERGADYTATAELVTMYFTTRSYDTITLPAGTYRALRITLGTGEGQNWWCVMFPPLCLPAVSAPLTEETEETEEAAASDGQSDVLLSFEQPQKIQIKFALYEFIKGLFSNK